MLSERVGTLHRFRVDRRVRGAFPSGSTGTTSGVDEEEDNTLADIFEALEAARCPGLGGDEIGGSSKSAVAVQKARVRVLVQDARAGAIGAEGRVAVQEFCASPVTLEQIFNFLSAAAEDARD